jgi:hypothetical protein
VQGNDDGQLPTSQLDMALPLTDLGEADTDQDSYDVGSTEYR